MATIELDLIDGDGVIVSVAQTDDGVWAQIAGQAQQAASQKGFVIVSGPVYNQAERTISNLGSIQNWLAAQNVGKTAPTPAPPATTSPGISTGAKVAWGLGGLLLVGLAVAAIRSGTNAQ